jgi:hypothetical protein
LIGAETGIKTIAAVHSQCRRWVDVVEKVGDEKVEALYWAFAGQFLTSVTGTSRWAWRL